MNYQYQPIVETDIRGEIIHEYRSIAAMAKALRIPQKVCHALVATRTTFQGSKFRRKTAAEEGTSAKSILIFSSSPILDENIEMDVFALPQIFKGRKVG